LKFLKIISALAVFAILFPQLTSAQPTDLVTTSGRDFIYNGQTYRFVGMNIRGISHYGHGNPLQFTTSAHITENLDGALEFGVDVVRLFSAANNRTAQENADNLEDVLDLMEARGMKAIISLTDVYNTPFHPMGDDSYYLPQTGGFTLLDDSWFAGGYEDNYLPWVQLVVNQLKDHNAVFAWEIGNEITDIKNPNNIIALVNDIAAEIKSIDPHHMVTTGFLSVDHTQIGIANGEALYENPNIDFISVHAYNGEDPYQNWVVNALVEKPIVMGEFGWENGDRVAATSTEMGVFLDDRHYDGFMHWGYQYQNFDIGDGDTRFGIDRNFHASDYDAFKALYASYATAFAGEFGAPDPVGPPSGMNIAVNSTAWDSSSNFNVSLGPDKAIDGVISTSSKWTSDGSGLPQWAAYDLGANADITGFGVVCSVEAGEDVRFGFKQYEIQTGTSLSGPWTTEFTVDDDARYGTRYFHFDSPNTARYVRLIIQDAGIDNFVRLPEFQVYSGTNATVESWNVF